MDQAAKLPGGERVQVVCADAPGWLRQASGVAGFDPAGFDLVFVDPPFAGDLWRPAFDALEGHLADGAWLYVESPSPVHPGAAWRPHREGRTRDVHSALYRRGPG